MTIPFLDRDGSIRDTDRETLAVQQLHFATMGRDYPGCTRVVSGREVGQMLPEDLCPGRAVFLVDFLDYRCGFSTGGVFSPAESINSRACPDCRGEVQRAPGFLRDRLITAVAS